MAIESILENSRKKNPRAQPTSQPPSSLEWIPEKKESGTLKYVICCYGNTRPIRKVYDWDPSRSLIIEPTLIGGVHNIAGSGGSGGVNNLGISHPGLQQQRQYSYPIGGGDDEKNDYHLFGTK